MLADRAGRTHWKARRQKHKRSNTPTARSLRNRQNDSKFTASTLMVTTTQSQ